MPWFDRKYVSWRKKAVCLANVCTSSIEILTGLTRGDLPVRRVQRNLMYTEIRLSMLLGFSEKKQKPTRPQRHYHSGSTGSVLSGAHIKKLFSKLYIFMGFNALNQFWSSFCYLIFFFNISCIPTTIFYLHKYDLNGRFPCFLVSLQNVSYTSLTMASIHKLALNTIKKGGKTLWWVEIIRES